jgi:drug/metabolite transporter (DMT)-like permease
MLLYTTGVSILKVIPQIATSSITSFNSIEFIIIVYTLKFLFIILLVFPLLMYDTKKTNKVSYDFLKKCKSVSYAEFLCILTYAGLSMTNLFFLFEMTKKEESTLLYILAKVLPIVIMTLVGIFLLQERITIQKSVGIFICIIGVYIITKK